MQSTDGFNNKNAKENVGGMDGLVSAVFYINNFKVSQQ
jgi:hypothetical protein